ncbi:uncharacterized protein tdrd12 [Lampris incognitus]|uniref:uncharacterized protein tdrd12 n=1 Tax=Lampris incognitus TaxID=2546036 RepID=UPI0024B4A56D|nr:uncharacterized protein tdrd12 [Lampris incognitus]
MLKISILKVENPSCIWGWTSGGPGADDAKECKDLQMRLNLFNSNVSLDVTKMKPSSVEEGQVYVVYWSSQKCWCRAKVEAVFPGTVGSEVRCLLVDYGEHLIVSSNDFRTAQQEFLKFPFWAKRFHLAGVKPTTMHVSICEAKAGLVPSNKWDIAAIRYFHNLLQASTQAEALMCETQADSIAIELYLSIKNVKICVNDDLVVKRFAYYVEEVAYSDSQKHRLKWTPVMFAFDVFSDTHSFLASNACAGRALPPIPHGTEKRRLFEAGKEDMPIFLSGPQINPENAQGSSDRVRSDVEDKLKPLGNKMATDSADTKRLLAWLNPESPNPDSDATDDDVHTFNPVSYKTMASRSSKQPKKDNNVTKKADLLASGTDMSTLTALLENLIVTISAEFKSAFSTFEAKLETIQTTVLDHEQRIGSLELNAEMISQSTQALETRCADLASNNVKLKAKVMDLEGRSRGNNIRIIGLPESIKQLHHGTAQSQPRGPSQEFSFLNFWSSYLATKFWTHYLQCGLLQLKILHRIHYTNARLAKMYPNDRHIEPSKVRILVHSALPLEPCSNLCDAPITKPLRKVLIEEGYSGPSMAERYCWSAVARGCDTILISHSAEHPLSYLPALLTNLQLSCSISTPASLTGPKAVILCPGWEKAQMLTDQLEKCKVKKIFQPMTVVLGVAKDEARTVKIPQNCLVLVTTPFSLVRLLVHHCFLFLRLCHLVLDQVDQLFSLAPDQMTTILQHFQKVTSSQKLVCPRQVIAVGKQWGSYMENLLADYMFSPCVVISAAEEAALYGGVHQVILHSLERNKMSALLNALDFKPAVRQKTLIITNSIEDVELVFKALSSASAFCLKTHQGLTHQLDSIVEMWRKNSGPGIQVNLVTTQGCLEALGIRDATCVVHYSFPTSPRLFGRQLLCMEQNFRNLTNKNHAKNGFSQPAKSLLLISERNARHVIGVLRYLRRAEALLPPELLSFCSGVFQATERQKTNRPFCSYLKSFGVCGAIGMCPDRHCFDSQLDQSHLPSSGMVAVLPLSIKTASVYCGRIVREADDCFERLASEMASYYAKERLAAQELVEGGLYGVKEAGMYHRVKVTSVPDQGEQLFSHVSVLFVDEGRKQKIKSYQLLQLPAKFHTLPPQAVEIILCRVKPVDCEPKWNPKVTRAIRQKIGGLLHKARIALSLGDTIFVEAMVRVNRVPGVKTFINEYDIHSEILKTGMGTSNPQHLDLLRELCEGGKTTDGKEANHISRLQDPVLANRLQLMSFWPTELSGPGIAAEPTQPLTNSNASGPDAPQFQPQEMIHPVTKPKQGMSSHLGDLNHQQFYHKSSNQTRQKLKQQKQRLSLEAIPWFPAADRMNYAKYMPVYIAEMKALEKSQPESYRFLREGGFVVRRSDNRNFNCVATDQALEQTINREGKSQGGIVGFTLRKGALKRWLITRHVTSEYRNAMIELCDGDTHTGTPKSHKEHGAARMDRDEREIAQIMEFVQDRQNPFDLEKIPDELINIASGQVASQKVTKDLSSFLEYGEKVNTAFIEERLKSEKPLSFWNPEKRHKLATFTDMKTCIATSKSMKLQMDSDVLFRRLLAVSKQRDVSLDNVMSHELAAVPPSLFYDDGEMRKTTKADLAKKLESVVEVMQELPEITAKSAYIIDGMALLQSLPDSAFLTFSDLAECILKKILSLLKKQEIKFVVIVFDRYDNPQSIKILERQRRGATDGPTHVITGVVVDNNQSNSQQVLTIDEPHSLGLPKSFHPQVKWFQRTDLVIVTVKLSNPESQHCDFYPNRVVYSCRVSGKFYEADLELHGTIAAECCSWEMKCNEPVLRLVKDRQGCWERLLKHKNLFVSYDLEHCGEDKDETPNGRFLRGMTQGGRCRYAGIADSNGGRFENGSPQSCFNSD